MSTNENDTKDICIDDQDNVDDQDDIDQLYGLDHYVSDDDNDDGVDEKGRVTNDARCVGSHHIDTVGVKVSGAGMGNSLVGLMYYSNNEDDPYITLKEEVHTLYLLQDNEYKKLDFAGVYRTLKTSSLKIIL